MPIPCSCCPLPEVAPRCAIDPLAVPAFFRDLGSVGRVEGPAGVFTYANFAGSGVTVTVSAIGETLTGTATSLAVGVSPPQFVDTTVTFSSPVYLRRFGLTDLDFPGLDEQAFNFVPQITAVYGQKVFQACDPANGATPAANPLGCVKDSVISGTGGVIIPGTLTSALTFRISRIGGGAGEFLTELGFDTAATLDYAPVFPHLCCDPVVGATYEIDWSYAHRARAAANETVRLRIGDASNPLGTNPIVDTHTAVFPAPVWTLRSGTLPIGAGFPSIRLEFQPVGGSPGSGNFLDAASIVLRRVTPTPANFGEQLLNGGFEAPVTPAPITFPVPAASTGWSTTEACNCLEYWRATSGVPPFAGNQFAEMNVFGFGTLYQNAALETCENVVTWYDTAGNPVPFGSTVACI